jgi:hypothetical protein
MQQQQHHHSTIAVCPQHQGGSHCNCHIHPITLRLMIVNAALFGPAATFQIVEGGFSSIIHLVSVKEKRKRK